MSADRFITECPLGTYKEGATKQSFEEICFNLMDFSHVCTFRMEHLVEICSGDLQLVSDVLDVFCVQGRQRLESLHECEKNVNLETAEFDAVRCC